MKIIQQKFCDMKTSKLISLILLICFGYLLFSCQKSELTLSYVNSSEDESPVNAFDTSQLRVGLIAYYPFSGNAKDRSGNNHNGIVSNATLTTDRFGKVNRAYYFDGLSSHIDISDDSAYDLTEDFSISSWFKMEQYASTYNASILISKHDGDTGNDGFIYGILNPNNDNNQFLIFGANGLWSIYPDSLIFVQTGVWYNYTVTYNKTTGLLSFYLNGVLASSQYVSVDMLTNDLPVSIGYSYSSYGTYYDYFNGTIDDIRIYNRVLSKREVQYLYRH